MTNKKRRYFRPLRKTFRPWQPPSPDSLKKTENVSPAADEKRADDPEWTADEWDRIWRSASE